MGTPQEYGNMPMAKKKSGQATGVAVEKAAEKVAYSIREELRQAHGYTGLVLCDLLLQDAKSQEGAFPEIGTGAIGSLMLPSSAWRVLVRLMEEWENNSRISLQRYRDREDLRSLVNKYQKGPRRRSEISQRARLHDSIRQWLETGDQRPRDLISMDITRDKLSNLEGFLKSHDVRVPSEHTLRREIRIVKQSLRP
jgi:hypothetical protein